MYTFLYKAVRLASLVTAVLLSGTVLSAGQTRTDFNVIDTHPFADAANHWYGIFDKHNIINPKKNQPRYRPNQIAQIADNILLYQKDNGGWPKNYDMQAILTDAQKDSLIKAKSATNTTFDNGTTYSQVACLAGVFYTTRQERFKAAAIRGIDFMMTAQYQNGGWPQYYPLEDNYSKHITYNDDAFIGIIEVFKDIVDDKPQYSFVTGAERRKVRAAYERGVDCILKTQITDNGKLTAWCQQHDETTLKPVWARTFEPPSICNGESVGIVKFLMSIKQPSAAVIHAVQAAVAWFNVSAISNTRVQIVQAPTDTTAYRVSKTDRVVIADTKAPLIWARYYELGTHRPLFANRGFKTVYSLSEVERERRDGYGWYTYAPQTVLNSYAKWKQQYVK